jgi:hypothetical protein
MQMVVQAPLFFAIVWLAFRGYRIFLTNVAGDDFVLVTSTLYSQQILVLSFE